MKTYMCLICGYVFKEEEGDPDAGIPPGTRWDDVPLSWRCPDCGARWFWDALMRPEIYGAVFKGSACPACQRDFAAADDAS